MKPKKRKKKPDLVAIRAECAKWQMEVSGLLAVIRDQLFDFYGEMSDKKHPLHEVWNPIEVRDCMNALADATCGMCGMAVIIPAPLSLSNPLRLCA